MRENGVEGGKYEAHASPNRCRLSPCRVPYPYPATARRRGCGGAATHRTFSAVSSPISDGTLPVMSLLYRRLREGGAGAGS